MKIFNFMAKTKKKFNATNLILFSRKSLKYQIRKCKKTDRNKIYFISYFVMAYLMSTDFFLKKETMYSFILSVFLKCIVKKEKQKE